MRLLIVLALLAYAAPVLGQTAPNRIDVVRQVSEADPARFACAHTGRPCEADWIKAVAWALHQTDARWGLNMKRDSDSQGLSLDVVTWRLGPTDRHVQAFDICGACGGGSPSVVWNDITVAATIGQPGTARWVRPQPVAGTPPPTPTPEPPAKPPPTPSPVDLSAVLAKLDAILAEIAVLRANHDGIAAVATEARDKAADAAVEALNAATRAAEVLANQGRCVVGRVPKAFGGSSEVMFCPAP